ncbi:MAG: hypothetical protein LBW85_01345 [Deltaproteobacteria bacterium]|jgi:hypothetical protein|nr:hypothetical protein [Deltaproteobacteria bacterium]
MDENRADGETVIREYPVHPTKDFGPLEAVKLAPHNIEEVNRWLYCNFNVTDTGDKACIFWVTTVEGVTKLNMSTVPYGYWITWLHGFGEKGAFHINPDMVARDFIRMAATSAPWEGAREEDA